MHLLPGYKEAIFLGDKLWVQSYSVETIENANEDVIRSLSLRSAYRT